MADDTWGQYYTNDNPTVINVSELTEANTLALYLYGALERPDNPADYMRDPAAPKVTAVVDGQKFFDTLGRIIPYVMASQSNDIPKFFNGDYDFAFAAANRTAVAGNNNLFKAELTLQQVNSKPWTFSFEFVNYANLPRQEWEAATFIYNSTNFRLSDSTKFVVYFDAAGNVVNRQVENVKYELGRVAPNNSNYDDYDYTTGSGFTGAIVSAISQYKHGLYHDPYNIGRGFEIDFGAAPVWDKSKEAQSSRPLSSASGSGEVWDKTRSDALRAQAAQWLSPGLEEWASIGAIISAENSGSGNDKPLKYQIDGHRLILGTGLQDDIKSTGLISSSAQTSHANSAILSQGGSVPDWRLYPNDYTQRVYGDYLYAGRGDDTLTASDYNDVLVGGLGADYMYGGAGYDEVQLEKRELTSGLNLTLRSASTGTWPFDTPGIKIESTNQELNGDQLFAVEYFKLTDSTDNVKVGDDVDGTKIKRLTFDLAGG